MGEKNKKIVDRSSVIGMAETTLIQQHGEAASQMIQAYKGVRYDSAGNDLSHQGRSLRDIGNYKVNDAYREQNIKQQSGFSAELVDEARKNKQAILNGDTQRVRTSDGLGDTNNTQYDHVKVDQNGNVIEGSGTQMKFLQTGVDKDGDRTFKVMDHLAKKEDWNRYDTQIDIPKGDYEDAIKYADKQITKLREQAIRAEQAGKQEVAEKLREQANGYEKAKDRIRESDTTSQEAIEARLHPKGFTTKEVVKDCHQTGIQAAKGAAIFSGAISISQNLYAVIAEGKEVDEAAKDVIKTTATSTAVAYGVGASGTALKAVMHSSSKEMMRRLGNTNAPALIATSVVAVTKSIKSYAKGEIDEVELLEELGQKGTGMMAAGFASAAGATVGGAVGSVVPVVGTALGATVGGIIGSMLGYAVSGVIYTGALDALKGEKISAERRAVIEALCEKAIEEEKAYQKRLTEYAMSQYHKREATFSKLFEELGTHIVDNNIDGFMMAVNKIGNEFGVQMQFNSFDEFDAFMLDQDSVLKF